MRIDVKHVTRSRFDKFKGVVGLFTQTLPLMMANKKVRSVLTESNIHSDKEFPRRRVKTSITTLVKGIPNKHTCMSPRGRFDLIRSKIMDISSTLKHTKRNLKNKTSKGVGLLKTV